VNMFNDDKCPRHAYPRPTFVRQRWLNLNGSWKFEFDDQETGLQDEWYRRANYSREVQVPFPFESRLSGIGDRSIHPRVWYARRFDLDKDFNDSRCLLHVDGVDHTSRVWLNGKLVGEHRGGYTPFSIDVTESVKPRDNLIVVYAEDLPDPRQCRGRQALTAKPDDGTYERTTGIWQTVWCEPVPQEYILSNHLVSSTLDGEVEFEVRVAAPQPGTEFMMRVFLRGLEVATFSAPTSELIRFTLNLPEVQLWSPEEPTLYTTEMRLLRDRQMVDKVRSYFGVRSVGVRADKILLNGEPYYHRMVLDQRYYPDGHYAAPHDALIKRDVEMAKSMGFNGIRCVHKVPEPRFLYWCDKLGLTVWEGMPGFMEWSHDSGQQFMAEWLEVFERDRDHPCITTWVLFEESIGLSRPKLDGRPAASLNDTPEIQEFLRQTVSTVRSVDPTRLVIDNSGWLHVDTDIVDIHDDAHVPKVLKNHIRTHWLGGRSRWIKGRELMVADGDYGGQPVVLSDYGGIRVNEVGRSPSEKGPEIDSADACDADQFPGKYEKLAKAIAQIKNICGRCYRQLTDVGADRTGLMGADRQPKIDCEQIAEINRRFPTGR